MFIIASIRTVNVEYKHEHEQGKLPYSCSFSSFLKNSLFLPWFRNTYKLKSVESWFCFTDILKLLSRVFLTAQKFPSRKEQSKA